MDLRACFLDGMFVSVAVPEEGSTIAGTVVICPSLLTDALAAYRAEVLLARSLAGRGVIGVRIHYRGTGHSEGDGSVTTFASMVSDAVRAADEFAPRGSGRLSFAGSRLGAMVAAGAAAQLPAASLLMWEPATDAELYFREAVRGRLMRETTQRDRSRSTTRSLFAQLDAGRTIDVLGYPLTPRLYRSFAGLTLAGLLDGYSGPTMAVHFGRSRARREALEELSAGRAIEVSEVPASLDWWLLDNDPRPPEPLIQHASGWLAARFEAGRVPR